MGCCGTASGPEEVLKSPSPCRAFRVTPFSHPHGDAAKWTVILILTNEEGEACIDHLFHVPVGSKELAETNSLTLPGNPVDSSSTHPFHSRFSGQTEARVGHVCAHCPLCLHHPPGTSEGRGLSRELVSQRDWREALGGTGKVWGVRGKRRQTRGGSAGWAQACFFFGCVVQFVGS